MLFGEQTPRLSVVISTCDRAEFLRNCLKSLEASGVPDLEVIVVDEGSTEEIKQVIVSSALKPRYLRQKNVGRANARNLGFEQSRGRFVGFLDCDQEWVAEAPARAIAFLDRHPEIDVLFAEARLGNRETGFISRIEDVGRAAFANLPVQKAEPNVRILENDPFFRLLAERNIVFLGSAILRRTVLEEVGLFDPLLGAAAEWHLWLRMATTKTFAYAEQPLCLDNQRAPGTSNDRDGLGKELCLALSKSLTQVVLTIEQHKWVKARLRRHLFDYAHHAFHCGDFAEARQRFTDLLWLGGFEFRGFLYWVCCSLPLGLGRRLRGLKRRIAGTKADVPVETYNAPPSRTVLTNSTENRP